MKNTFKIIIAAIVFATLGSCSDEQNYQLAQAQGSFTIKTPLTGTSTVLTPAGAVQLVLDNVGVGPDNMLYA